MPRAAFGQPGEGLVDTGEVEFDGRRLGAVKQHIHAGLATVAAGAPGHRFDTTIGAQRAAGGQ